MDAVRALILNSGVGSRMGETSGHRPKCMTPIGCGHTIVSWQLEALKRAGVTDVVMTTGPWADELQRYAAAYMPGIQYVHNPRFYETNYIYSMYLARELLDDDVILLHGDLVLEEPVLRELVLSEYSAVAVEEEAPLPEKDFRANRTGNRVVKIGVGIFGMDCVASQPAYKLLKADMHLWLEAIETFCNRGETGVYAENALNTVLDRLWLTPLLLRGRLCREIDTPEDLEAVSAQFQRRQTVRGEEKKKRIYMCFSTDLIHQGHLHIIKEAAALGELTVGVLTDEVIASYKRYPLIPLSERVEMFSAIKGISRVVVQDQLSYAKVLQTLRPDVVVHGDDWRSGYQAHIRREVIELLAQWGGKLVEYPYTNSETEETISRLDQLLNLPENRRSRLKKLLSYKPCLSVLEAHNGLTGLIVENTKVENAQGIREFDAIWVSSLCDSTAKGKPDIELVDMTSRIKTLEEIMEVTTKPIILDGDTGGLTEHFVFNIRTLERIGISAVIIEDKQGLKKNSLFGTAVKQTQDSVENFCEKIRAGKDALKTKDFMIFARCESLILERGMEDALTRCFSYVKAGADGIMIHSRKKGPEEIFEFCRRFRSVERDVPLVVVPTTFNTVTEAEFAAAGVNIVIHANHMIRSAFPSMQRCAEMILEHGRSWEAGSICMPIGQILTLIKDT